MELPTRQMLVGNLALVGCCFFYLLWWLLAFRPVGPIKGMRTGWLLVPAVVAGAAALVLIIRGASSAHVTDRLLPTVPLLVAGVVLYVVLAVATRVALDRPVTTELFLIIGWAVLVSYEVSTLRGSGALGPGPAIGFLTTVLVALVVSLVCYVLYYRLGEVAGYAVGMVPLASAAVVMGALSVTVVTGRTG